MTEAERRYVCRLIDVAVEACELANLREELEVRRWIADLIVSLQAATGEDLRIPKDTIDAHGCLLDLRERYMPGRDSLEVPEQAPEPRACTTCGRPIRRPRRRWECPNCRKLKRLVRRAEAALAS